MIILDAQKGIFDSLYELVYPVVNPIVQCNKKILN